MHEHPPEVSAAGGKELIEQELAFHEQWKVYASGSKADRIGHLAKTMFVGNDGSALHGDLAQGAIGAGTQFGMGLGVKLLATKTIASRVPGVGNIIGGALSAYSLFSNGGAGIKKMGSEISEGIGGAFSAKNWSESPWLTAANLVSGIKGVFELAGHILNILSGLAYAFAAIAALGGLLSVFFPPLAILVPYIPMAVNFGRACGGIATVCMGIANLLSPIPPVLRAIHLIFSDNDPIKLVGAEKKYHEDVQGALATYGSAKMSNALSAKGSKTLGIAADPNAPKSVYGKGGSIQSEMKEGFGAYKDAMGGNVAPTPANFAKGTENTKQALGIPDNVTGGKTGNAKDIGASYFNPEGRATANAAATDAAEKKVDKAEKQLDVDKKNQAYVEGRADKAQQRLDANPTEKNFKAASNAAATAEKHEAKVEASEASVKSAEQTAKLAEHRQEIVQGRQGAEGIGGSAGDAGDSARKQAIENHDAPIEKGKEKSADEAFESLREGQAPVEATRNAAGHIQLPDPPGNLQEVESIDEEIEALRKQQEAAHETGTEAKQVQKETSTQASGLDTASAGVTAKVQGEQTRSAAEQAKVKQQNTDMQAKTAETGASTKGGISQGGGSLNTIAGAARTIDGFLGRVPSNKFFDPSATKNNVHQFVVGLDTITGANGQQSSSQAQATSAVGQRTSQVNEAQTANAAANTEGQKLAQDMKADASTAKTASSQAAGVANEAKTAEAGAKAKIAQLTSQRQQKWQALLAWAAQHRALREQAKTPE